MCGKAGNTYFYGLSVLYCWRFYDKSHCNMVQDCDIFFCGFGGRKSITTGYTEKLCSLGYEYCLRLEVTVKMKIQPRDGLLHSWPKVKNINSIFKFPSWNLYFTT